MSLSVQRRAESVATFRFIQVALMETVARWTPRTPEMEVKVLFGRHIWDLAQQADALGKRTYELRAPLQFSLKPVDSYLAFLDELAQISSTSEKIAAFYEAVLPALTVRYQHYLEATDGLLDEPSCRVIERILRDFERMQAEAQSLLNELPKLRTAPTDFVERLRKQEAALEDIVAHRPTAAAA